LLRKGFQLIGRVITLHIENEGLHRLSNPLVQVLYRVSHILGIALEANHSTDGACWIYWDVDNGDLQREDMRLEIIAELETSYAFHIPEPIQDNEMILLARQTSQ
jgi:DNA-directed RNA polymerase subunit L